MTRPASLATSATAPKIVLGADGFGDDLKQSVIAHLESKGVDVEDVGTEKYFDVAGKVARRVQADLEGTKGMLFCGTGMGVGIVANKFSNVWAATCENEFAARCSRAINDSNVLALGGKVTSPDEANRIVDAWLEQEFQKPPCAAGEQPPEWWSSDVEDFLGGKFPDIKAIEKESRGM